MKKGSILVMAIWMIAVLSIMVLSFSTEAYMQSGINIFVRERNRVIRLVDAGRILGEIVLLGYADAPDWSADENEADLDEDDRWFREKRRLKSESRCTIGPVLLDEENPGSGTVKVDIELSNSGTSDGVNVNELYEGGDRNYRLRWQMLLSSCGIHEELEVPDEEGRSVNLMSYIIACWNDWRDEDDVVTAMDGEELGAEAKWYEERDEEEDIEEDDRRRPRNGSIPSIQELSYIRAFRQYPNVLIGGKLRPDEDVSEDNPEITGIIGLLSTSGSSKITVTPKTKVMQLVSIPGIYNEEDVEDQSEAYETAQAIIDTLKIPPDDDRADEPGREWWPYKDWADLRARVEDNFDVELGQEASEYIEYRPSETSVFKMTITGESLGFKRVVRCECYVKDKKVRYITWQED